MSIDRPDLSGFTTSALIDELEQRTGNFDPPFNPQLEHASSRDLADELRTRGTSLAFAAAARTLLPYVERRHREASAAAVDMAHAAVAEQWSRTVDTLQLIADGRA